MFTEENSKIMHKQKENLKYFNIKSFYQNLYEMHVKVCKELESPNNSIENCFTENPDIESRKKIRFLIKIKVMKAKEKNLIL
jgi:hypothetical protein